MADETGQAPKDVIGFLDYYLVKKAPIQIPEEGRELLVKWGPWIAVIILALMFPLALTVLGVGSLLRPYAGDVYATGLGIGTAFFLLHFALMVMALPGLFARKKAGWRLMFYSQIAGLVQSVLYLTVGTGLVMTLISFYLLFQVRTKYH